MEQGHLVLAGGAAIFAVASLFAGHRANKRRRLLTALPTSSVQGVFIGLVELKGSAETERPFSSWLANQSCVLYSWRVDEHWRRVVQESYTDQNGRRQTRTRVETGVVTVASGGESAPFYLRDDSGVILINPDGAEIRPLQFVQLTCGPSHPFYFDRGPRGAIPNTTMTRTFVETGIPLHTQLFVVGEARERTDIVAPEIHAAPKAPLYLLTTESEEQVLDRYGWSRSGWGIGGLFASGLAGWAPFLNDSGNQGLITALIAAAAFAALWLLSWTILIYNSLVDSRNRVRQGWSLLEVQLKRRADLIPQLVSIVDGLKSHERDVQETLAALRNQLAATPDGQQGPDFSGVAPQIVRLAEHYPALSASPAFAQLQSHLIQTEQRIALARAYFNDAASAYNNAIEIFPDRLFASLGGFRRMPLLEAHDFERASVRVQLAS
jgi:hypothetical protein